MSGVESMVPNIRALEPELSCTEEEGNISSVLADSKVHDSLSNDLSVK